MKNPVSIYRLICAFGLGTSLLFSSPCFCDDLSSLSKKYKDYNVILLTIDAMRPDHLGCYGYDKDTSPSIDALAKHGLVFENAFSQSSLTAMSLSSIYTSLYPYSHGVRYIFKDQLSAKTITLAQIMKRHGYKTAWFGLKEAPHLSIPGLLKGFDNISQEYLLPSWIEENGNKKFFITMHSYMTHEYSFLFLNYKNQFSQPKPQKLQAKLDSMDKLTHNWNKESLEAFLDLAEIEEGPKKEWAQEKKNALREEFRKLQKQNPPEKLRLEEFRNLMVGVFFLSSTKLDAPVLESMLDSTIYEVDRSIIQKLVDQLTKSGILEKTIIIIAADHGNEFMEHGRIGHAVFTYDESIHIPLIIYIPHLAKPSRIKGLAEGIDIFPTILDLLGIDIPPQAQGISLISNKNQPHSAPLKEYIISESLIGQLCLRSEKWKLLGKFDRNTDTFQARELFDLENDPKEQVNIITKNPAVAEKLQAILLSKLRSLKKYRDIDRPFLPITDEKMRATIMKTGYW